MSYIIRYATVNDIQSLGELLDAYMQETFQRTWGGTIQQLEQDGFGTEFEIIIAETSEQEIIAFAAWKSSYDLHHCVKGAEVIDLFVCPSHRGHGVAMLLLANVAVESQKHGGKYIKGQAVDNPAAQRLYRRCARCFPLSDCYVSGRAFRRLGHLQVIKYPAVY
jgi:GNAT superfamily N-acetyltransferase